MCLGRSWQLDGLLALLCLLSVVLLGQVHADIKVVLDVRKDHLFQVALDHWVVLGLHTLDRNLLLRLEFEPRRQLLEVVLINLLIVIQIDYSALAVELKSFVVEQRYLLRSSHECVLATQEFDVVFLSGKAVLDLGLSVDDGATGVNFGLIRLSIRYAHADRLLGLEIKDFLHRFSLLSKLAPPLVRGQVWRVHRGTQMVLAMDPDREPLP